MYPFLTMIKNFRTASTLFIALMLAFLFLFLSTGDQSTLSAEVEPAATDATDGYLNVVGTVPLAHEMMEKRFILFFDRAIDLNVADFAKHVSIEPAVSGGPSVGDNYIAFSSGYFRAGTIYRVALSPSLRSVDGKPLNPEHRTFFFATEAMKLAKMWVREQDKKSLTVSMLFNYPVALQKLKEKLKVVDTATDLDYTLTQNLTDREYTLRVEKDKIAWPITVQIKTGLEERSGKLKLYGDVQRTFSFDMSLTLESLSWQHIERGKQQFELRFSHKVEPSVLAKHLEIKQIPSSNPVSFSVLTNEFSKEHSIETSIEDIQRLNMNVCIIKGLQGEEERIVAHDINRNLQHQMEQMSIQDAYFYGSREGLYLRMRTNKNMQTDKPASDYLPYVDIVPPIDNLEIRFQSWSHETLLIHGDWKKDTSYQVTLKEGFPFQEGKLATPLVRHVKTGDLPTVIQFGLPGQYYFPDRNQIHLPIETRNVSQLKLTLYRLFANNIPAALRDINAGQGSVYFTSRWCEKVEEATLQIDGASHKRIESGINLDELFPADKRGVYCIHADNGSHVQDTKIVLYTDIGVLAHWTNGEMVAFVHDLFSLKPIPNAKITVYSDKSQVLGVKHTGADGMVHLTDFETYKGSASLVVVEHGDDFTFLELSHRGFSSKEISGDMPGYNRDGYDAFIYADRDLYRPGETVHAAWIVRTRYGDALAQVPLQLSVLKPNGKVLFSEAVTLSDLGSGEKAIATQSSYPTGKYTVQLSVPGSNRTIGRYSFHLEDFIPQRIKVAVSADAEIFFPDTEYPITVQAHHLFGAPAANRKTEAKLLLRKGGFQPTGWEDYIFDNDSTFNAEQISLGESRTNEEGQAEFSLSYRPKEDVTFPLHAVVVGDVFELGGRAVSGKVGGTFLPSEPLLGVHASSDDARRGIQIHAAAVKANGAPAEIASVSITLEREIWNYYVRRYQSNNQPNWSKTYQVVKTVEAEVKDGRAAVYLDDVNDYGYYRVRVHSDATKQYSSMKFYSSYGRCHVGETSEPGLIKIVLDQKAYRIGDEVKVRIESPFDGQGVVVVQGEDLQHIIPVTIADNVGQFSLRLEEKDYPNIWLEATVVHEVKTDSAQVYPFSSFGVKNIVVHHPQRELSIEYPGLPEEIRPARKTVFDVKICDQDGAPVNAQVTLAAVDEGVHAITNYTTPNPYRHFARPRQPDLRRAHYYDRVIYDFEKLLPGGGMMADMMKRAASQPLDNWVKPVALWSGIVQTGDDGVARVEMELPEYTGQLRLVAVACDAKASGSKEGFLYVRRPYMLRTSVPRFLLPGDSFLSRAVVFNQTDAACRVRIRWSSEGALTDNQGEMNFELAAQGEKDVTANLLAQNLVGQGRIQWHAEFMDEAGAIVETVHEDLAMPVYPPASYQSKQEISVIKPGQSASFDMEEFTRDTRNTMAITVSANALVRIKDALSYVVGYPYGCVEQTTSRLMPLYLLRKNEALLDTTLADTRIDEYLRVGMDRLFAMQTLSGGLAYWPGGTQPDAYGSVYAFHFLTMVKNGREIPVPEINYQALKSYVRTVSEDWSQEGPSSLYLRAYALYTLALAGDLKSLEQIQRFDEIAIPRASRYLLAAALAMSSHDPDRVSFYLSKTPVSEFNERELGGTLNSEIRNTAVELMALQQMKADPEEIAKHANTLLTFLERNRHGSTQETAFIATALSGYLTLLGENIENASVTIETSEGKENLTGTQLYHQTLEGASPTCRVSNTGTTDVYVNLVRHGIPLQPQEEVLQDGLAVERTLLKNNEKYDDVLFQQGDTYIVDIQITCASVLKNVVVSDLLPAGFEVENSRLDPDQVPDSQLQSAIMPSFLEIRDDKVVCAFNRLEKGEHHFYYIVRAVTPGSYQYPSLVAECMYDPNSKATTLAQRIQIQ